MMGVAVLSVEGLKRKAQRAKGMSAKKTKLGSRHCKKHAAALARMARKRTGCVNGRLDISRSSQ
jgi:hypothetical protein